MAGILMNLNMARINDLSSIVAVLLNMLFKEKSKNVFMSPAKMESVGDSVRNI